MATLWITEYADLGRDFKGQVVHVGMEPSLVSQSVTYTSSTQSAFLHPKTRFVRVKADADAYLKWGENPTATVSDTPIEANVAEYFGVEIVRNQQMRIAAYDGVS